MCRVCFIGNHILDADMKYVLFRLLNVLLVISNCTQCCYEVCFGINYVGTCKRLHVFTGKNTFMTFTFNSNVIFSINGYHLILVIIKPDKIIVTIYVLKLLP